MRKYVAAFMMLAACGEATDGPQALPQSIIELRGVKVVAQVADDADERAKGLMFVKAMPQDHGMLFVWPEAQVRSFWMKNTYIALDLLYVNKGMVVSIAENAKPHDETGISSGQPADMVLEVNAGWVKAHGVAVGDMLTVK